MLCTACNKDLHPIIEGDQSGRFSYTCSNGGCHANLGPVKREAPPAATASTPTVPTAAAPCYVPSQIQKSGLIEDLRTRLATIEMHLSFDDALRIERQTLRRMLAAADRVPRAPKARTNVLPMKKATK